MINGLFESMSYYTILITSKHNKFSHFRQETKSNFNTCIPNLVNVSCTNHLAIELESTSNFN